MRKQNKTQQKQMDIVFNTYFEIKNRYPNRSATDSSKGVHKTKRSKQLQTSTRGSNSKENKKTSDRLLGAGVELLERGDEIHRVLM